MSELPSCAVVSWQISIIVKATEVLTTATKTTINLNLSSEKALQPHSERERGKIEIYRSHFEKLLQSPLDLRDRVLIEAALLQAMRPGEISALTVEGHNFDTGDLTFMDSKKYTYFTRPMDPVYAEDAETYIIETGVTVGFLLQPKPNAHHIGRKPGSKTRGMGLSCSFIEKRFKQCEIAAGVPPKPPRVARAYWICNEHYVLRKPLAYCSWFLRHNTVQATEHYVYCDVVDCESMKEIFYQGRQSPVPDACVLMDHCDLSTFGCHCRLFQPKPLKWIEVKTP